MESAGLTPYLISYNFITTGYLSKSEKVANAARLYYGDITFGEAYENWPRCKYFGNNTHRNWISPVVVELPVDAFGSVMECCCGVMCIAWFDPISKTYGQNNQGDIVPYSSGLVYADINPRGFTDATFGRVVQC